MVVFSVVIQYNLTGYRVFISTSVIAYNSNKTVYRQRRLSDTRAYSCCLPSLCVRTNGFGLSTTVLRGPKRLNYKWHYDGGKFIFFSLKYDDPIIIRLRSHVLYIRTDDQSSIWRATSVQLTWGKRRFYTSKSACLRLKDCVTSHKSLNYIGIPNNNKNKSYSFKALVLDLRP